MPTETFFNLAKEKQERILKAAEREFSRVGLKEASIARVIKEADISRGSFYQYFEDKEDLYYYYFQTLKTNGHRFLMQAIEENQGDLFAGVEEYFMRLLPEVFEGENQAFFRHLFMNMDAHGFQRVIPYLEKKQNRQLEDHAKAMKQNQAHLIQVVNRSNLAVANEEELLLLFKMLMHVLFSTIAEGYREQNKQIDTTLERITQRFLTKLQWLKAGARKDESDD
ncbi:TetR/AcrR family transcriptional regulator [Enterococcus sp. LJL98]